MANKKILIRIFMFGLPILALVLVIFLFIQAKKVTPESIFAPPTEIITPTPTMIRPTSRWATDSGVLEIEQKLGELSQDLERVDLKESGLLPPLLDMEVKF